MRFIIKPDKKIDFPKDFDSQAQYMSLCALRHDVFNNNDKNNTKIRKMILTKKMPREILQQFLCYIASIRGDLTTVQNMHKNNLCIDNYCCDLAAKNNQLEILKYMHKNGYHGSEKTLSIAVNYGNLKIVEFLTEIKKSDWAYYYCGDLPHIFNCSLEIAKCLCENYPKCNEDFLSVAIINGRLDIVKYLYETGLKFENPYQLSLSAKYGHLKMLKFFKENIGISDFTIFNDISKTKHLHIIKYLRKVFPNRKYSQSVAYAADNGHLDILKYLHNIYKFNCDNSTLAFAIFRGRFKIFKYLCENVCQIDSTSFNYALEVGNLRVIKYLYKNGYPIVAQFPKEIKKNSSAVIKFLIERGC